jgi:hypothetical protein
MENKYHNSISQFLRIVIKIGDSMSSCQNVPQKNVKKYPTRLVMFFEIIYDLILIKT